MRGYVSTKLVDFYDVLGVSRSESQPQIKKAYYALVKTWHPDKNLESSDEITAMFNLIQEAYEKLSDPFQRARFDQDLSVYEKKFGPLPPNKLYREKPRRTESKRVVPDLSNLSPPLKSKDPQLGTSELKGALEKPSKVTLKMHLSLEEIYIGVIKKLLITRNFLDGRKSREFIKVQVPRGWKRGRTVLVKAAGDQLPGGKFQDIEFEIVHKPHDVFRVEGNDLVMDVELTLLESLCGFSKTLYHISGSTFQYETDKCTPHGLADRIPECGLPDAADPMYSFDLLIQFKVKLPEKLTKEQIVCLRSVF